MMLRNVIRLLFVLSTVVVVASCGREKAQGRSGKHQKMAECLIADTTFHNLGVVGYSDVVTVSNTIVNNSKEPVSITEVETDCGCLTADYDNSPIESDEKRRISFEYDTNGQMGQQLHVADIYLSNGQSLKVCFFADVRAPRQGRH